MIRLITPFLVLLALLGMSVWLDRPQPRADFVFVDRDEVFTLDPQRMSWMQDFRMAYALYEPLVRWRNDDFSIVPAACESMPQVSEDGRTYTFRLRRDAKWSNGAPVTAHDFAWSWMRAILPDTAADYTMMLFHIEGARAFFEWRAERLRTFLLAAPPGRGAGGGDAADQLDPALALWLETEQRFRDAVGIDIIDDHTLRLTLERPTPYFLDLLCFGPFNPVYRPCVEGWRMDDAARQAVIERGWHTIEPPPFDRRTFVSLHPISGRLEQLHEWTKPGVLVTNGPLILTDWRYKRGIRLERNPHYHSPERVKCGSVAVVSISDPNTAILAFKRGDVDWVSEVAVDYQPDLIDQLERYLARHRSELDRLLATGLSMDEALAQLPPPEAGRGERRDIHILPTFGTDFYSFNCRPLLADGRNNPFHDARVRRAFVASVDRHAIVTQVTRLNEPVATALTPPRSIPGYDVPDGLGYDPPYAREQLKQAGWLDRNGDGLIENERGEPFPIVDLLYSTNTSRYRDISLALRDMWQRELGVRVELRGKENKTFKEDLRSGQFMIGRGRWYGDYGDPTTFLDICRTGDGNNDRGYSNPRVDDLLNQAARETDPAKRFAILRECERYLFAEEVPMLVLCNLVQLYLYEPGRVRGLTHHPRLSQYLWQVEVVE